MGKASVKIVGNIITSAAESEIKTLGIPKINSITVKSGVTMFDRYVQITLDTPNPEKYTVKYGDSQFVYDSKARIFKNVVMIADDEEAKDISKYTVDIN